MGGGPDVLDPEVIAELTRLAGESGNRAFLTQLVTIFLTNAPARLAQIREAVAQRDAPSLEGAAHTLRSNCGMLGASRMAEYCASLESMGERQAMDEAAALLPAVETEFAQVVRAVQGLEASAASP